MDGTIQSQTMDSSKLVQRFQDGEREAFDALVNLYQHRVLKLTYQFTRNPEDAADLAQEAFLRAFQGLESFQGKSAFYSWLYRITKNVCIDFHRRERHSRPLSLDADDDDRQPNLNPPQQTYPSPAEIVLRRELQGQIKVAVENLPPRQKEAFVMRYQEGLLVRKIAQRMGKSEGTIKSHLFHALRRIRRHLKPYLDI